VDGQIIHRSAALFSYGALAAVGVYCSCSELSPQAFQADSEEQWFDRPNRPRITETDRRRPSPNSYGNPDTDTVRQI